MKKKRVAIIGTNGIPARYGGFETLAENLTKELNAKYDFIVYCSKKQKTGLKVFNNSKLINLPLNANGWQAIIYDAIALFHAWFSADIILALGPTAGFLLPMNKLFKKKIVVNHGGLNEWEREKYSKIQSKIIYLNHKTAAKYSTFSVVDNNLLAESLKTNFNKLSNVIRYGGDHVKKIPITEIDIKKYPFLNESYAVSVSRAQVDNNIHLVLEAFETITTLKLIMIANWQISSYGINLKNKYKNHEHLILLDAIYDKDELNLIRSNAYLYIHSHSQCGTAPSLVEAMSLGLPIISFDVPTNRETTQNEALYFKDSQELTQMINHLRLDSVQQNMNNMYEIAQHNYKWVHIASQYDKLFTSI